MLRGSSIPGMKFCDVVRSARRSKSPIMTQRALAEVVGVSRETIISIEKGKTTPNALLAIKLSRVLGFSFDSIEL